MPFNGQGACALKAPPHPQPSTSGGGIKKRALPVGEAVESRKLTPSADRVDPVAHAQAPSANLTGRVASIAEGALEGVLVSARKDGSSITHTVVSDAAGRFDFASARLAAGRYALQIRAAGYELDSAATADIPASPRGSCS